MCFNDTFCFSVGNFLIWRLYNYAQAEKEFAIDKIDGNRVQWQVYRTSDIEGEDLMPVEKVKSGKTVRIPARSIITLLSKPLS